MSEERWHWDKKVPIALLVALTLQTFAAGWWASATSERVSSLERQMIVVSPQADRITRLEVNMEALKEGISDIKRLLVQPR